MSDNPAKPHPLAFAALLVGSTSLAFGPWLVRLADVGPVATGFWRLALAIPFLLLIAPLIGQPIRLPRRAIAVTVAIAAAFYAADLAAWNAGILLTKLGNATLFGNISSFAFAAWGLWLVRRWPSPMQAAALLLAAAGAAMLMASSAELSASHLRGDLLALLAGLLYTGYLIGIERARGELAAIPLLLMATVVGAALLLPLALVLGEQVWPRDWTPLLIFALSSQVLGQGLLVYAIGALPPLVVGLALLTQPAVAGFIGWAVYGETLSLLDWLGTAAIAVALVLVRLPGRGLQPSADRTS
ncbi:MAG: DMT family transporter [Pseudomonadota bacterium]|nr:DMT family transporter [Pseudomonadota bacterium]